MLRDKIKSIEKTFKLNSLVLEQNYNLKKV